MAADPAQIRVEQALFVRIGEAKNLPSKDLLSTPRLAFIIRVCGRIFVFVPRSCPASLRVFRRRGARPRPWCRSSGSEGVVWTGLAWVLSVMPDLSLESLGRAIRGREDIKGCRSRRDPMPRPTPGFGEPGRVGVTGQSGELKGAGVGKPAIIQSVLFLSRCCWFHRYSWNSRPVSLGGFLYLCCKC